MSSKFVNRQGIITGLVLVGFTSLLAQIVLIRELLVLFYGNELSLGIILACWLWWTAIGSGLLGRIVDKLKNTLAVFLITQIILSLLLPATFLASRALRILLQIPPGELIGPLPMIYSTFVVLAPLGLCLGFLFTLTCRIYSQNIDQADIAIGRSYLFEGIGAALAGILFTYLLVKLLLPWQMLLFTAGINLIIAVILCFYEFKFNKIFVVGGVGVVLLLVLSGNLPFIVDKIESESLNWRWSGLSVIDSKDSPYGNITLTRHGEQASLWGNGLLIFSYPDLLSAEESVHFALLEHPQPFRVLLIGAGVGGGSLVEALKHPSVGVVDYVELDPLSIELGQKALPSDKRKVLQDKRVNIHHQDGRFFIKKTTNKYDMVIINLPEPYTAQLNRFYTREFFQEVKSILTESGIISLSFTSSENYLSLELAQFLGSIYFSLKDIFPQVIALPGDSNFLLACNKPEVLTADADVLARRLQERRLDTKYVREYYLPFRLSGERVDYLSKRLEEQAGVRLNDDFSPVSYYYNMLLWFTYVSPKWREAFSYLAKLSWQWGAILLFLLVVFFIGVWRKPQLWRGRAVLYAVMTTGFAEISFEVIIVLGFQILFGYLYYQIGLILAGFMLGLAIGSYYATRLLPKLKNPYGVIRITQLIVCLYPLFLIAIFKSLSGLKMTGAIQVGFPFLTAIAGLVGGFQFPLATKVYLEQGTGVGRTIGITYGIDLAGACLGALLVSTIFLPLIGIYQTCVLLSLLNFSALLMLLKY